MTSRKQYCPDCGFILFESDNAWCPECGWRQLLSIKHKEETEETVTILFELSEVQSEKISTDH